MRVRTWAPVALALTFMVILRYVEHYVFRWALRRTERWHDWREECG